jgi:hypothetical protein
MRVQPRALEAEHDSLAEALDGRADPPLSDINRQLERADQEHALDEVALDRPAEHPRAHRLDVDGDVRQFRQGGPSLPAAATGPVE